MIRYYYTRVKLFWLTARSIRLKRRLTDTYGKLTKLQTVITAGFTSEKEFTDFNKRLIENRKHSLDPNNEKRLEEIRNKNFNKWKPTKHFKDSRDKQAQREGQHRSDFVRIIKNRPLVQNPQDSRPDMSPDEAKKMISEQADKLNKG